MLPETGSKEDFKKATDAVIIADLKKALRDAILSPGRVSEVCVDFDPAGSTYEIDWLPNVKEWAQLCDLDLTIRSPEHYARH